MKKSAGVIVLSEYEDVEGQGVAWDATATQGLVDYIRNFGVPTVMSDFRSHVNFMNDLQILLPLVASRWSLTDWHLIVIRKSTNPYGMTKDELEEQYMAIKELFDNNVIVSHSEWKGIMDVDPESVSVVSAVVNAKFPVPPFKSPFLWSTHSTMNYNSKDPELLSYIRQRHLRGLVRTVEVRDFLLQGVLKL